MTKLKGLIQQTIMGWYKMNILRLCIAACLISIFMQCKAQAEIVEITTAKGHIATADFMPGDDSMGAILILHGFLQTREFSTVARLSTALHDAGYTVLAPSLTLGLNHRNRSLDCEAVHTHSLEQDSEELRQWIQWLEKKSGKQVYLIGHSAAGTVILNYHLQNPRASHPVSVLISLSYYASGPEASETAEHATMARQALKTASKSIQPYALNYCKTYPSYPAAFLSYYDWDKERTIEAISKLSDKIHIIIGNNDRRIDSSWREYIQSIENYVTTIDGANHFFDQAHEFDLHDAVETILTNN